MVQKVYIVIGTDAPSYGDSSWIHDVFLDKAMAEKCAEICSNISASEGNSYYVDEREIKTYDLDTKTAEYYSYGVNKEKPFNDILQMTDVYYELVEYLDLPKEFEEVERKDDSMTPWGTKSHQKSLEYIKNYLSEDKQKEVIAEMNKPEYRYYDDDSTDVKVYKGDLYVDETDDYIEVFSVNSFEEAKNTALQLYEKWLAQ